MRESIEEYVNSCDVTQLKTLIEKAKARQKYLESAGQVTLFGVFSSKDLPKWFPTLSEAKAAFVESAQNDLEERYPEVSLERHRVFIEDLPVYLGAHRAKQYVENSSSLQRNDESNAGETLDDR